MKKLLLSAALIAASFASTAQVGVGTTNPKAALDVTSDTNGILLPRMTQAEIDLIATPEEGLILYNKDIQSLQVYVTNEDGTKNWATIGGRNFEVVNSGDNQKNGVTTGGDNNESARLSLRKHGGTAEAKTVPIIGSIIGAVDMSAYNGTEFAGSIAVAGFSDGPVFNNKVPGRLRLQTTSSVSEENLPTNWITLNSKGNVGMGINEPDPSAKLEVVSTTGGFLPPRMTRVQMGAIQNPAAGLMVYCTDCSPASIQVSNGSGFAAITDASGISNPLAGGDINFSSNIQGATLTFVESYSANGAGAKTASVYKWLRADDKAGTNVADISGGTAQTYDLVAGDAGKWIAVELTVTATNGQTATITSSYIPGQITLDGKVYGATRGVVDVDGNGVGDNIWLDRNIGATQVATSATDAAAFGGYFQFGRTADGHEFATASELYNGEVDGFATTIAANSGTWDAKFIVGGGTWVTDTSLLADVWLGTGGVNTPCPSGTKVPSQEEIAAEIVSITTDDGVEDTTEIFNSPLKLVTQGIRGRGAGAPVQQTNNAFYWTSRAISSALNAFPYEIYPTSNRIYFENSASGISVRCMVD